MKKNATYLLLFVKTLDLFFLYIFDTIIPPIFEAPKLCFQIFFGNFIITTETSVANIYTVLIKLNLLRTQILKKVGRRE